MTSQGKRVLGIVAEYNPFHNGHLYHLTKAKRLSGCDYTVVVMSGDFVQRGLPAITDKYTRAEFALKAGADVVLELPLPVACGSAEFFAKGAVSLLQHLGIVDAICFGCEEDDLTSLKKLADFLTDEPEEYQLLLRESLRSGRNFPTARQAALAAYRQDNDNNPYFSDDEAVLLNTPNNILAVEYLKALKLLGSGMEPLAIRRQGMGYHEIALPGQNAGHNDTDTTSATSAEKAELHFASATAIRQTISGTVVPSANPTSFLRAQLPDFVFRRLTSPEFCPVCEDDLIPLLTHKLSELAAAAFQAGRPFREELIRFQDVTPELADRLEDCLHEVWDYASLVKKLLCRGYTATRLNRALLHILFDITEKEMGALAKQDYAPYARILGIKKESSHILRSVADHGRIPLITKVADAGNLLTKESLSILRQDIAAAELYNQLVYSRSHSLVRIESDYFHRFITI